MVHNGYKTFNLPALLVEELKVWRMAFSNASGKSMSYADIIYEMIRALPTTHPDVMAEMEHILAKHPELTVSLRETNK
jgi:hypothetical protein